MTEKHEYRLPRDEEAERSLVGICLVDPYVIDKVRERVKPTDFWNSACNIVFETICMMRDVEEDIADVLLVKDRLVQRGKFQEIGGVVFLAKLTEAIGSPGNAIAYAEIVASCSKRRAFAMIGLRLREEATRAGEFMKPDELTNWLEAEVASIGAEIEDDVISQRDVSR